MSTIAKSLVKSYIHPLDGGTTTISRLSFDCVSILHHKISAQDVLIFRKVSMSRMEDDRRAGGGYSVIVWKSGHRQPVIAVGLRVRGLRSRAAQGTQGNSDVVTANLANADTLTILDY